MKLLTGYGAAALLVLMMACESPWEDAATEAPPNIIYILAIIRTSSAAAPHQQSASGLVLQDGAPSL